MSDDEDPLLLVEKTCAVTAFDTKIQVSRDGRERGLWVFVRDHSHERCANRARYLGVNPLLVANCVVDEGGLMEWDDVEDFYRAIGRELAERKKNKKRAK